jgi:hypothetical protein
MNAISSYAIPLLNVAISLSLYKGAMVYHFPNSGMKSKLAKTVIFMSNWQNLSSQSWAVLKAAEYSIPS